MAREIMCKEDGVLNIIGALNAICIDLQNVENDLNGTEADASSLGVTNLDISQVQENINASQKTIKNIIQYIKSLLDGLTDAEQKNIGIIDELITTFTKVVKAAKYTISITNDGIEKVLHIPEGMIGGKYINDKYVAFCKYIGDSRLPRYYQDIPEYRKKKDWKNLYPFGKNSIATDGCAICAICNLAYLMGNPYITPEWVTGFLYAGDSKNGGTDGGLGGPIDQMLSVLRNAS